MVNFRFHLVSLTAVFLAIAIGIAIGATVVDQATVDALQNRLRSVERGVQQTHGENDRLRQQLDGWARFAEEADAEAVAERLRDVPVVVLGVRGVDRAPVDRLRQSLALAGARLQGTVWFTSRVGLQKEEDTVALAALVGGPRSPDALRRALVARLVDSFTGREPPALLVALRATSFVEFEPPERPAADLSALPLAGSLFVVVSGAGTDVPNDQLAIPLAGQLAPASGSRVLAAEAVEEPPASGRPEQRAVFVGPLRQDPAVSGLLSTVDNLEDFRGRFAVVYALRDLVEGKVGHFGVGPGADRLIPQTAS